MSRVTEGRLHALVILALLGCPVWTEAQTQSFADLPGRLQVGRLVIVVDQAGVETTGSLLEVSAQSLVIIPARVSAGGVAVSAEGPRQTFTEASVAAVLRADSAGRPGEVVYAAPGTLAGLRGGVEPGQTIIVTDNAGRRTRGRFAEVTPGTLVLLTPERGSDGKDTWSRRESFAASNVSEIRQPGTLWNGLIVGLGFGVIPGWVATASCSGCDNIFIPNALITGAIGAGIGVAIDAAFGPKRIYRGGATRGAGLQLEPVVGGGVRAARLTWQF